MAPMHWLQRVAAAAVALLALASCDEQRIRELQPGISTEADVRERFGVPDRVWPEDDGSQTLEYDRQPAGRTNYMITIGPDGRMSAYAQVLTPQHFARVQPGMHEDQVRRLLGRPAKRATYELKQQTEWDWYWNDGPGREMAFTVVFDAGGRVLRSGSSERLHEGP